MMKTISWWMCAALLVAGCGTSDGSAGAASTGGTGGAGGIGGGGGASLRQVLPPVDGDPAFAVVSTDYTSTSVSLLDGDGDLLVADWLTSGSTWPGLVAALSGDVVLPSRQMGDGSLVVIDRLNTDVVSRFDMRTGGLYGQVRTQGPSGMAAFSSDPHDVVVLSETSAWVTRHQPSFEPSPEPDVAGNDLFEIDPSAMTLTGRRVDLSPFNAMVGDVATYARPDRVVRAGDYLVVGLVGLDELFTTAAPGSVALVEIASGEAARVPLANVTNCGSVAPTPGVSATVVVACQGSSATFDPAEQRMTAGIYVLRIDGEGDAAVVRSWRPAEDENAANTVANVVPFNDRQVMAVANGTFGVSPDGFYLLDLETGAQTLIFESTGGASAGAFEIGQGAYDALNGLLLIPVRNEGVRRYSVDGNELVLIDTIDVSEAGGLGPVSVSPLR